MSLQEILLENLAMFLSSLNGLFSGFVGQAQAFMSSLTGQLSSLMGICVGNFSTFTGLLLDALADILPPA
jgi:hypothetical protein